MSTTIDYQRKAYSYRDGFNDLAFIVLHETGANNCYDMSGRRARSWRILADGSQYQVSRKICEYAGHSAGGMLVLNRMGNWHSDFTDPIRFIRAYDKTLKAAIPLEQADESDKKLIDQYRTAKTQNPKGA